MYAPVCTRFRTYDVRLPRDCAAYCANILEWPYMTQWLKAAKAEPDELAELDLQAQ